MQLKKKKKQSMNKVWFIHTIKGYEMIKIFQYKKIKNRFNTKDSLK